MTLTLVTCEACPAGALAKAGATCDLTLVTCEACPAGALAKAGATCDV